MRDSCNSARSAVRFPPDPASSPALNHIGILRLIDRFDAASLRDWLTLRCFLDAARSSANGTPIPDKVLAHWATHSLRGRRGAPLLPRRPTFESRHLLAQLTASLTARDGATSPLDNAVAARVHRNFLASRKRADARIDTPAALDAALRSLTADFMRLGAMPPDADPCPEASARPVLDIDGLDESSSAAELFDRWRATFRGAGGGPSAIPDGPLDIVSKMRPGDLRVVRERPTDIRAWLEVTFPTHPPQTLEVALRPSLARSLPAFCNPLGPVEHDALRAELRHIPACRAALEDDVRRDRLYWSATTRYAGAPPPRRGMRQRARPWRATALRAMVLASSWGGEPMSGPMRENDDPRNGLGTWLASPWAVCQRWWQTGPFPIAMTHAATPATAGFRDFDGVDEFDGADEEDKVDGVGEAEVTQSPPGIEMSAAMDAPPRFVSPAQDRDDDVTLVWAHVSPGVRRRLIAGARRFAKYSPVLDGSEGPRNDDAIRRLNDEGWYAYSNIPAMFLICETVLDDRQMLDQTAFHALLGDIGRTASHGRAHHVLCFEDRRNGALSWRVDTTAAPGEDVMPIATPVATGHVNATGGNGTAGNGTAEASTDATDATDAKDSLRRESGSRLVLKQILALLAQTNDPPFELDTLLCAMIEVKHDYDADIARHAGRSVAEIRTAIRRAALERLVDVNRRGFPRRHASIDAIATPGAMRFVDFLLGLFDPVLQAAPDTLAYGGTEVFQARFGHYFAERNGKPGVTPARWASITSQGREYVKGWGILTQDMHYLAAMNAENSVLVRYLQSLFENEIVRSTLLYNILREGPLQSRSEMAKRFLADAGIPPEHRIAFRKFIGLNEAQSNPASLRHFEGGTFLDVYMAFDNGLERLRDAEPRYRSLLSDAALAHLPSRQDVIDQFNLAFDDKARNLLRFVRSGIEAGFAASTAAIKRDFAAAARLRLHLHRPLTTEKSSVAQYLPSMDEDAHRYQRNVFGHSIGAIIETIKAVGPSRFYFFDVDRFAMGNRTAMLTPLPEIGDAHAAGQYMMRRPREFFTEHFPSIYDEPIYYKNDVRPHLQYDCGGVHGVWEKWIAFRASHLAWRKRTLLEEINFEKLQDDPSSLYLGMLPFYTCESVREARALTLNVVLDGIFCLVDLAGLRHVLKPMRTWIAHSAAVGRIEKKLVWYEARGKHSSLDAQTVSARVDALRAAQKTVEELRRRRSTQEIAIAFRKIGHLPFGHPASTSYRLYQAAQIMLELGERIRPFKETGRETPMQRFLRWQTRNRIWELRASHSVEPGNGRATIVSELRHGEEQALPHRLREATCSPNVCVSACLFDSLASMTTRRRLRIFVKLLDGVSPQNIVRQSVRQGFLLTSDMLRELTQLETDFASLREKFAAVRGFDYAPHPRRRGILSQALLHPYANTTANARLQAIPAYRELAGDLYALNFFFESPLQQLVQTLDSPGEPNQSCRAPTGNETTLEARDALSPPDLETATTPLPPAASDTTSTTGTVTMLERDGACTRPGEDNEIRTCLLPITPCADQRSLPAPPPR
ncbi:MAG: hypothetical protein ACRYGL_00925 [Janthinobacterium lividum]